MISFFDFVQQTAAGGATMMSFLRYSVNEPNKNTALNA